MGMGKDTPPPTQLSLLHDFRTFFHSGTNYIQKGGGGGLPVCSTVQNKMRSLQVVECENYGRRLRGRE